jgi:hypothetical protein
MTVSELFTLTIGMMGMNADNASTYAGPFLQQLNMILAQTFKLENNVRLYNELALLTTIPRVTATTDTLTYQDELLFNVVPWGVAQLMSLSDDDTIKAGFFGMRYSDEANRASRFIRGDITDYYSTQEEEEA